MDETKRTPGATYKARDQLVFSICSRKDLDTPDKLVARSLIDHFNFKTGQCNPGYKRLALVCGIARSTVVEAIEELERKGVITCQRGGGKTTNHYSFAGLAIEGSALRTGEGSAARTGRGSGTRTGVGVRDADPSAARTRGVRDADPNYEGNYYPSHEDELGEVISPPRAHAHMREGGR